MTDEPTIVCPDCGGERFSIIYSQVAFGSVREWDGQRDIEIGKTGGIVDSDDEMFCVTCHSERPPDELVTQEEYDGDD